MKQKASHPAALAAALPLLLSAAGCAGGRQPAETVYAPQSADLMENITAHAADGTAPDAEFRRAQMQFTMQLCSQVMTARKGENTMLSPYSVMQALGMTANGAAGETQTQMLSVLAGQMSAEQLNNYLCAWRKAQGDSENSHLETANAIWMRDTPALNVHEPFLQTNADYYDAAAHKAAFDQDTVREINSWVSDRTEKMIPKLLDSISGDAMLYLVNAAAFEAKWISPYSRETVQKDWFFPQDGGKQSVQMMHSTEYVYLQGGGAVGFEKPYEGNYLFAAILPPEGTSPAEWLVQQSADSVLAMLDSAESADVYAAMPKFSYDTDSELSGVLKAMGMELAFSDDADFTAMADIDARLAISRVIHKTHIEVDTDGTKAAAATAVEMRCQGAMEPQDYYTVDLNRPFLYMILDTETNLPVFIGSVEHF